MKIFDHRRNELLDVNDLGWKYKDVVNQIYDGIQEIKGTGFVCPEWEPVFKRWSKNLEIHEYDILVVELRCGKREVDIFGIIQWIENIGSFVFRRSDTGKTVTINGLHNPKNIGSSLEIPEKDIDKTWRTIQYAEHENKQKQNA